MCPDCAKAEAELVAERERASRLESAGIRALAIIRDHGRRFPGSLHAEEYWCDCGFCYLRMTLRNAAPELTLQQELTALGAAGGSEMDRGWAAPDPTPSEEELIWPMPETRRVPARKGRTSERPTFSIDPDEAGSEQPDLPLGHPYHRDPMFAVCVDCGQPEAAHRSKEKP